jgi:hypothetical protein
MSTSGNEDDWDDAAPVVAKPNLPNLPVRIRHSASSSSTEHKPPSTGHKRFEGSGHRTYIHTYIRVV